MDFRVIAISTAIADEVRTSGKSPRYGHPTHIDLATGHGPCRHCLKTFQVGQENRILFTYDPFAGIEQVPLPGPVFLHEQRCDRYDETLGYPDDLKPYPVVLNAYKKGQTLVQRQLVAASDDKEHSVRLLLDQPGVDYIEVRDQRAGCFDLRIERNGGKELQC